MNLNWDDKEKIKNSIEDLDVISFQDVELVSSPINNKILEKPELPPQIPVIEWKNLLICGDNTKILRVLLKKFANKINLIYIDPPFATGGEFNYKIQIGEGKTSKQSKHWIRKIAYRDSWSSGLNSYLSFIYEKLLLMKELLSETGSIYIHLDWHIGHYIKVIMDEIFGIENFRNEIIWAYPAASVQTKRFYVRSFDIILFYTKSDNYTFNDNPNIYMEYSDRVKTALKEDDKGLYYHRGGSHNGKKLSQKVYVKNKGVFPRDVWNDIPYVRANTKEYQGFSTQKPERLLKRIILASSTENDLIADFFCGSGTTLAVAEKLGRRWIGCDITKQAINICKKRLLDICNSNDLYNWKNKYSKNVRPFKILEIKTQEKQFIFPIEFLSKNSEIKENSEFFQAPNLKINIKKQDMKVAISLKDYTIPYVNSISEKIRENILNWADWIDSWSIDFNYNGKIFNNMWVSYRTPKKRELSLIALFNYDKPGDYQILVKVIDVLGIETIQNYDLRII